MDNTTNLHISISPHIKTPKTTATIMRDVIIALLPTSVAGCIIFGWQALLVLVVATASAVFAEFLYCLIVKKTQTVTDYSAAVTGLLLGLNLPANTPLWQVALGAVFAIIFVKCIFGGIGKNFANPAIVGRVFMLIAFTEVAKSAYPTWDTTSSATPLPGLAAGEAPKLLDLFLGNCGGAIGEVCTLALLIGGAYLLVRRVITLHAPASFILTVFLFSLCLDGFDFMLAIGWILSGGLVIGAIYMATDYVTTPTTGLGKIIFGIGAGLITVMIRFFGVYPEGVSFAILFMNILTPYIDKWTPRRPFGGKINEKKAA